MEPSNKVASTDFDEWMITKALGSYLGARGRLNPEGMQWLFSLKATTLQGPVELSRLCGFAWDSGTVDGGPEESFKKDVPSDRGRMSAERFEKYWTSAPDFRYWTKGSGEKQLIIEAEGLGKLARLLEIAVGYSRAT